MMDLRPNIFRNEVWGSRGMRKNLFVGANSVKAALGLARSWASPVDCMAAAKLLCMPKAKSWEANEAQEIERAQY